MTVTQEQAEGMIDELLRAMEDLKFAQNMRRSGDEERERENIKRRRAALIAALTAPVASTADAVAAEREACAALCERFAKRFMNAAECAAAIRARGQGGAT